MTSVMGLLGAVARVWACEPGDVGAVVDRANSLLSANKVAEARLLLEQTYNSLPNRCDPVVPAHLGRLLFVAGVVALEDGDTVGADRWFDLHHTQVPLVPPPAGMSGTAFAAYEGRRSVVATAGIGELVVTVPLFLDGVAAAPGAVLMVAAGVHLVQPPLGASWTGTWFTAEAGLRLALLSGEVVHEPMEASSPRLALGFTGAGLGALALGGGGMLWLAAPSGTWATDCRTGKATGVPLTSNLEGLRACAAATGNPILAKEVLAISAVSLGAVFTLTGGTLLVLHPAGAAVHTRF